MKAWVDLYRDQRAARKLASTWSAELRKRLVALATAGHCDKSVEGRFTWKNDGGLVAWSIRDGGVAAPLRLEAIGDLASAELSVMALADRRDHLHQFTVMVEGKRPDGTAWAIAVHFEDDRVTQKSPCGDQKGTGACGHAAFHSHVGPGLDLGPKVRVPLPAFGPVEALEWVLSQIVPTAAFEPAPWPAVRASLEKASA